MGVGAVEARRARFCGWAWEDGCGEGRSESYGDTAGLEVLFHLSDGEGSEMRDGGDEDGVGMRVSDGVVEMLEGAGAAGGDDGDFDGLGDGAGHGDIVAGLHAVGVHAGGEDGAGAEGFGLDGPLNGVDSSAFATAADDDFEA